MKIKSFLIFALLVGVVSLFAFYPSRKDNEPTPKESILLQSIISFLDQAHFKPVTIDDTFSKNLFIDYLDILDHSKRFLIKSDIDQMRQYELILDDQIRSSKLDFFDLSLKILDNSLVRARKFTNDILAQPMSFDKKEIAQVDYDSIDYARDEKELRQRWYQALKYEVLQEVADYQNRSKNDSVVTDKTEPVKSMAVVEKESREKVLKDFEKMFDRISQLRREDRLSDFLNIICSQYDPHTSYLSPRDKEDFNVGMTGKLIGIGARLQAEGEYIKVVEVVPGGPAWKDKELAVNDVIIKVRQEGEAPLDIRGMRIDDVVSKIRGKLGTKVTLTVKKPNGTTKDITIIREEVVMDEGFAKSEILSLDGVINNVGYINLPKFYADFEDNSGRFSYSDVAKEIEYLKKENVNGIIIDLRNNPGGSLNDVIKMSGLFIEKGPIVQVRSKGRNPYVMSDDDPSFLYDGPLVIMINHNSASASEIMAAALQDYKRAVVIGSHSTYGKGTVQRFFDLDRAVRGNDGVKPLGEVKATIQKYYRVNGGSTQLKGVTPDIVLPDIYNYIKTGEEENKHPMSWSQIPPAKYSQDVFVIKNLNEVLANSKSRTSQNPIFGIIDQNAKRVKAQMDRKTVPLDLETYTAEMETRKAEEKKFNDLFEDIEGMNVTNLAIKLPEINSDSVKISRNEAFIKKLKKDIYLEEAIRVIKDLQSNKVAGKF